MRTVWAALVWIGIASALCAQEPSAPPAGELPVVEIAPTPPTERPAAVDRMSMMGGGGGPGGPGGPFYQAEWYPQRPVSGQSADLGLVRQTLNLGLPLWIGNDGDDLLLGTFRLKHSLFQTDALLPDSGRPFPEQLWNIGTGLTYIHRFGNGWTMGLSGQFGTASDQPFQSLAEMTLSGLAFLKVPAAREPDSWNFAIFYSPNGQLNFPVPGISYDWNPTNRLKVGIGIPFSVRWTPTDAWLLEFRYTPLTQIYSRATWSPTDRLSLFWGFEWTNEGYFLADRINRQDTFFYFEKRLVSGLQAQPHRFCTLELAGGYAFDRVYGVGRTQSAADTDGITVAPGLFLMGMLKIRF
jgi:hypothetical protein